MTSASPVEAREAFSFRYLQLGLSSSSYQFAQNYRRATLHWDDGTEHRSPSPESWDQQEKPPFAPALLLAGEKHIVSVPSCKKRAHSPFMRVLKLANMGYFAITSLTCHTGLGEPFAHVGSVRGSSLLLKTSADSDSSALDHFRLCKVISTQVHSWDRAYEMRSLCINHGQTSYRIHHFMLPILDISSLDSSPWTKPS